MGFKARTSKKQEVEYDHEWGESCLPGAVVCDACGLVLPDHKGLAYRAPCREVLRRAYHQALEEASERDGYPFTHPNTALVLDAKIKRIRKLQRRLGVTT